MRCKDYLHSITGEFILYMRLAEKIGDISWKIGRILVLKMGLGRFPPNF